MTWYNKTYVIVDVVDITQDMINECIETSLDTLRINVAETQAILKWYSREDTPSTITALEPAPDQHTNAGIKAILNNPENGWIEAE